MDEGALDGFDSEVQQIELEARQPFEWAEAALLLDVASRASDTQRVARHIHQSCALHAEHFRRSNFVKIAYIGRFYLTEVRAGNPIGITAAARAMLELHAFLRRVQRELRQIADGPPPEWRSRGQRFFDVITRARFGTSNPVVAAALKEAGMPEGLRSPYRITECVKMLQQSDSVRFGWLLDHYAFLCDWVHANQSSQTASTAGARLGNEILIGAGKMLFAGEVTIIRHEYGSKLASEHLVHRTLERARANFLDSLASIRETPDTPFVDTSERIRLTGNIAGTDYLPQRMN